VSDGHAPEPGSAAGDPAAAGISRRTWIRLGAGLASLGVTGCGSSAQVTGGLAFGQRIRLVEPEPPPMMSPPLPVPDPSTVPRSRPAYTLRDYALQPVPGTLVLTIDDGPHPRWTPRVLDVLAANRIRATFCLVGSEVRERPRLAARIVAEGHTVCNHTMNHPARLGRMPAAALEREIDDASQQIADATGVLPRSFRAPGGNWNASVLAAVAERSLVPVGWTVDPQDWRQPGAGVIVRRMLTARSGQILLCHDGGGDRRETVSALARAIPELKRRGLRFVPL
jgi:peptidoglycan-N-acetylglucosamine deacetylase